MARRRGLVGRQGRPVLRAVLEGAAEGKVKRCETAASTGSRPLPVSRAETFTFIITNQLCLNLHLLGQTNFHTKNCLKHYFSNLTVRKTPKCHKIDVMEMHISIETETEKYLWKGPLGFQELSPTRHIDCVEQSAVKIHSPVYVAESAHLT